MAGPTFLAIAGIAISAIGTLSSAKAKSDAARFNASQARQEAERRTKEAAVEEGESRRRSSRLLGRQRALVGGSGITSEGTPLRVAADTAAEAEFQALKIRSAGEADALRLRNRGRLSDAAARGAIRAGIFQAGGTALTGVSRLGQVGETEPLFTGRRETTSRRGGIGGV